MDGFAIEKLIFQSLPGVYVTALVYVPDDHSKKHPACWCPRGTRRMENSTIKHLVNDWRDEGTW